MISIIRQLKEFKRDDKIGLHLPEERCSRRDIVKAGLFGLAALTLPYLSGCGKSYGNPNEDEKPAA